MSWNTGQFVTADDPSLIGIVSKSLIDVLTEYVTLSNGLLAEAGLAPIVDAKLGPAPLYDLKFAGGNEDATKILTSWPSPAGAALLLKLRSEIVAAEIDRGGAAEAIAVNAMRLERLYLQYEYALRIERFARKGANALRNLDQRKITPDAVAAALARSRTRSVSDVALRLKPEPVRRETLSKWLAKNPEHDWRKK